MTHTPLNLIVLRKNNLSLAATGAQLLFTPGSRFQPFMAQIITRAVSGVIVSPATISIGQSAAAYADIIAAISHHDIPALVEVIDRLADDTGVHAKLMNLRTERLLMIAGKVWLETENVPWELLRPEMQALPGHFAQGLVLDTQHLFYGVTFGQG